MSNLVKKKSFLKIPISLAFAKLLLWLSCILGFAFASGENVSMKLNQWVRLQEDNVSFSEASRFIDTNPSWPRLEALQRRAEQSLKGIEDSPDVVNWFKKHPPLTVTGKSIQIRTLLKKGQETDAIALIKKTWIEDDFDSSSFKRFNEEFGKYLTPEDYNQRLNYLLSFEKIDEARRYLPMVDKNHQALAAARMAMIQKKSEIPPIPETLRSDPGVLYEKAKLYRRQDKDEKALEILTSRRIGESEKILPSLWWQERNIMARRMIEAKRYKDAFEIINKHQLVSGEDYAHAEWMMGWLSLRFLKDPHKAFSTFKNLYEKVKAPISRSRAAFWAGEAAAALKLDSEKMDWLQKASLHAGTYYGQLANARLEEMGHIISTSSLFKKTSISQTVRKKFEDRELVKALHTLISQGKHDFDEAFVIRLAEVIDDNERSLLIELVHEKKNASAAIRTAKKAARGATLIVSQAYPTLSDALVKKMEKTHPVLPFLSHAIIRQESCFDASALSGAGAQGLMQLMPATAAEEARKIKKEKGTTISTRSLYNKDANITLGVSHLHTLLNQFNGSLVLAIAAYNAGGKAVNQWLIDFGDPRDPSVDIIDWIEHIPYAETRNYVQRVMENFGLYFHRLKPVSPYKLKKYSIFHFLKGKF